MTIWDSEINSLHKTEEQVLRNNIFGCLGTKKLNGWLVVSLFDTIIINEHVREKTNNLGFRPGLTQTGMYSHRSRLET